MAPNKSYNRNASILESPPQPTYAEALMEQHEFRFQPRSTTGIGGSSTNEKIDLRAISKVDIDRMIQDCDLEVLQENELLENIVFGELMEEDFDLYSNDCFLKLFRLNQLTLEYLLDVQSTLAINLNALAKKYAAKKREVSSLSTNLARQDAEVATLRDEIHWMRKEERMRSPTNVTVLDPASFPSQEKREKADIEMQELDAVDEVYKSSESESGNGIIRMNIVSSVHGKHLLLEVSSSITVQDLKQQLTEKLSSDISDVDSWNISFKGDYLIDPQQTIKAVGIDDKHNAIVLEKATNETKSPSEPLPVETPKEEIAAMAPNDALASRIEQLVSTAKTAHEELVEASRTLQFQASMQDESNDAILDYIQAHLQGLEGVVRDTIEKNLRDAVIDVGQKHDSTTQTMAKTGAQLDIGEIESDHGDEEVDKDSDSDSKADGDAKLNMDDNEQPCKPELWVDTNAEYNGLLCKAEPSNVESTHSLDCPRELNIPNKSADDIGDDESTGISFPLPGAYAVENEISEVLSDVRPPTPSKETVEELALASKKDTTEEDADNPNLEPVVVSMPTPPSLKKIHGKMNHFAFSDYDSEDCVSVNVLDETYDSKNDFSKICGFKPAEITSGVSNEEIAVDPDMQSIEVSQSEFQVVADATSEEVPVSEGKSKGLGRKRIGKKLNFKKMMPKWKKKSSHRGEDLSQEKGKLYGL